LWVDDVRSSMHWVGNVWLDALTQVGMEGCRVHEGPMTGGALGELVCFAGVGPGEVVHASGAKLVGIAQRRTREHARFQCTALLRWVPHDLVELLAEPPSDVEALQHRVGIVDVEPAVLVAAFLRSLP
jgi:lipoate-protein ligase A